MAAREALQTKQGALELSLGELLSSGRRDDGDGGRGCPSDDAVRREGAEVVTEVAALEEQLATLQLQLHITEDALEQRRQVS